MVKLDDEVPAGMRGFFCQKWQAEAASPDLEDFGDGCPASPGWVFNNTRKVSFLCRSLSLAHGYVAASRLLLGEYHFELRVDGVVMDVCSHPDAEARVRDSSWFLDGREMFGEVGLVDEGPESGLEGDGFLES